MAMRKFELLSVIVAVFLAVYRVNGFYIVNSVSSGRFESQNRVEYVVHNAKAKIDHHEMVEFFVEQIIDRVKSQDLETLEKVIATLLQKDPRNIAIDDEYEGDDEKDDSYEQMLNGVVRIYCTHSQPHFSMPWQRQKQEFSTSSGLIISNRRILTNAHAVEYGTLIQVKKRQSETKYLAKAIAIGHECDLAVLEVLDDSFWEDTTELVFGSIPALQEDVTVIGYPIGGDSISITSGVVSRVEMQEYAQASAQLLAIQIDAAINPGNSGGPVFNDRNEVIGVAFQSLSEEDIENIGYVIPTTVVSHFLNSVDASKPNGGDGRYHVCGLGIRLQDLESKALRKLVGLTGKETGVRISEIAPLAPAAKFLRRDDVILAVDGIIIANDGTIPLRFTPIRSSNSPISNSSKSSTVNSNKNNEERKQQPQRERVSMAYYFTQRYLGDLVTLDILRAGKKMKIQVATWSNLPLIPQSLLLPGAKDQLQGPSYLIAGGLVFQRVTVEYLRSELDLKHATDYLEQLAEEFRILSLADEHRQFEDEEIILMSQVLSAPCNTGYDGYNRMRLEICQGQRVKNMRHLKSIVDKVLSSGEEQIVFEFSKGMIIVLDVKEVLEAQDKICKEHFIPALCSPDLLM